MAASFDFRHAPGYLIRRAHQRSVAIFCEETDGFDVTPVQFAILNALIDTPGMDQVTLSSMVAFDAATSGSVIGRLEAKGLVRRESAEDDRRRKLLWVTDAGAQVVQRMKRPVARAGARILAPLSDEEKALLVSLLDRIVSADQADHG